MKRALLIFSTTEWTIKLVLPGKFRMYIEPTRQKDK
jgi:hypothetical protein